MSMSASPATISEAPAGAIDAAHLSQMTLGEISLQREVLALFDRQADILMPRIRDAAPAAAAASAHTLKGSAVSIGAFKVARATEQVEQVQAEGRHGSGMIEALDTLARALDETRAEIARLLAA